MGLAPDLTWSSLPSPKDPLADDFVEVLDAVASLKPGAGESQANGRVRIPNEDHAIPGGTGDNSTEDWPSEEVLLIDLETGAAETPGMACKDLRGGPHQPWRDHRQPHRGLARGGGIGGLA